MLTKAAQLALLVIEVPLQAGVFRRQIREQFANGGARCFDGILLIGEYGRSERSRDENFCHGSDCPLQSSIDSSVRNHTVIPSAVSAFAIVKPSPL